MDASADAALEARLLDLVRDRELFEVLPSQALSSSFTTAFPVTLPPDSGPVFEGSAPVTTSQLAEWYEEVDQSYEAGLQQRSLGKADVQWMEPNAFLIKTRFLAHLNKAPIGSDVPTPSIYARLLSSPDSDAEPELSRAKTLFESFIDHIRICLQLVPAVGLSSLLPPPFLRLRSATDAKPRPSSASGRMSLPRSAVTTTRRSSSSLQNYRTRPRGHTRNASSASCASLSAATADSSGSSGM